MTVQRQKTQSLVGWAEEPQFGLDAGIGTVLSVPLADEADIPNDQNLIESKLYRGDREAGSILGGLFNSSSGIPCLMDAEFLPYVIKASSGAGFYSRVGKKHRWGLHKAAGSFQLITLFTEEDPTVLQWRDRGHRVGDLEFQGATEGAVRYNIKTMGTGSETQEDLAITPVDLDFDDFSYLDGRIMLGGTVLADIMEFTDTMHFNLARNDPFYNGGIADGINPGKFSADGRLGIELKDDAFYLYGKNHTPLSMEWYCFNAPIDATPGPTKYVRKIYPTCYFGLTKPKAGGEGGATHSAPWKVARPKYGTRADIWFPTAGPYALVAGKKIEYKLDGGATVTKTIAVTNAAATAAELVAELGADFEVFAGRPRAFSATLGEASSVQFVTTDPDSIHALMGLDNVAHTGHATSSVIWEVYNDNDSDI